MGLSAEALSLTKSASMRANTRTEPHEAVAAGRPVIGGPNCA
jgi:hypothetical protein